VFRWRAPGDVERNVAGLTITSSVIGSRWRNSSRRRRTVSRPQPQSAPRVASPPRGRGGGDGRARSAGQITGLGARAVALAGGCGHRCCHRQRLV
jgi:hypothetical protein